jgi:hypothetical protein
MDLQLIEACLDAECALWDWARTAGVSSAELREWLAAVIDESWDDLKSALPL